MPSRQRKFRSKSKGNKAARGTNRPRGSRKNNNQYGSNYALIKRQPTAMNKHGMFRTQCMFSSAVSMAAATTLLRVDIIPTLNLFRIQNTATRFMTYRMLRVNYQLIPRFNLSSMAGTLPVIYSVPILSNKLPAPSVLAFTSFANCRIQPTQKTFKGSFVPRAYSDSAEATLMVKSPMLETTFDTRLHYGQSLLISKPGTVGAQYILAITAQFVFIDFDDQPVALQTVNFQSSFLNRLKRLNVPNKIEQQFQMVQSRDQKRATSNNSNSSRR